MGEASCTCSPLVDHACLWRGHGLVSRKTAGNQNFSFQHLPLLWSLCLMHQGSRGSDSKSVQSLESPCF